jgi:hypothetical protein
MVPQYFSSSDREWAKRQARELDAYEFRQATIKRYVPDMKYGREDVIKLADRFEMEISGLKPYMGKKDALRTFRDFLTSYVCYHEIDRKIKKSHKEPPLGQVIVQKMCPMIGAPKEILAWVEEFHDLQQSARIIERFLTHGMMNDLPKKEHSSGHAHPGVPAIKLYRKSDHTTYQITDNQRALSAVFFKWDRMMRVHGRITCNIVEDLFMHLNELENTGKIPIIEDPHALEPFKRYNRFEIEEFIKEIYVTAIITASGRYIPMEPDQLQRWLGNAKLLKGFGYPPERLTELLHKLVVLWFNMNEDEHKELWRQAGDLEIGDVNTLSAHPLLRGLQGKIKPVVVEKKEEEAVEPEENKKKGRRGKRERGAPWRGRGNRAKTPEYGAEEWVLEQPELD